MEIVAFIRLADRIRSAYAYLRMRYFSCLSALLALACNTTIQPGADVISQGPGGTVGRPAGSASPSPFTSGAGEPAPEVRDSGAPAEARDASLDATVDVVVDSSLGSAGSGSDVDAAADAASAGGSGAAGAAGQPAAAGAAAGSGAAGSVAPPGVEVALCALTVHQDLTSGDSRQIVVSLSGGSSGPSTTVYAVPGQSPPFTADKTCTAAVCSGVETSLRSGSTLRIGWVIGTQGGNTNESQSHQTTPCVLGPSDQVTAYHLSASLTYSHFDIVGEVRGIRAQ